MNTSAGPARCEPIPLWPVCGSRPPGDPRLHRPGESGIRTALDGAFRRSLPSTGKPPGTGAPPRDLPVSSLRFWPVGPYLVVYLNKKPIEVVAIVHGARDVPPACPSERCSDPRNLPAPPATPSPNSSTASMPPAAPVILPPGHRKTPGQGRRQPRPARRARPGRRTRRSPISTPFTPKHFTQNWLRSAIPTATPTRRPPSQLANPSTIPSLPCRAYQAYQGPSGALPGRRAKIEWFRFHGFPQRAQCAAARSRKPHRRTPTDSCRSGQRQDPRHHPSHRAHRHHPP